MRAMVTGGAGFLGSYLATYLNSQGVSVTATHLPKTAPTGMEFPKGVATAVLDVRDRAAVKRVLDAIRPDVVYHFAGQAYIIPSWNDPVATYDTNVMGTLNLLDHIGRTRPRTQFAFAGSSAAYGVAEVIPTPESAPLRPTSPYASSKAAGDLLCFQYFCSYGLPVYRYRIYGTSGPGKRGDSLNDFASQVARLERTPGPRAVRVGNLDTERDVTDVRDAVRAMVLVVERGVPGDAYNIGSGLPHNVRRTLEGFLALAHVPITIEADPAKVRKVDEPVILGDVSKLRELGWSPEIPFDRTLKDILDWWRRWGESVPSSPPLVLGQAPRERRRRTYPQSRRRRKVRSGSGSHRRRRRSTKLR